MKKFLFIALAILTNATLFAQEYNFPVKPGTVAWKQLKFHEEKVRVCQIPDGVLKAMSTKDLLQSCLNYPLLFDMYAYDNLQIGFSQMSEKFNGFAILRSRPDAATAIIDKYKKMDPDIVNTLKSEEDKGKFSMLLSATEILISTDPILKQLTNEQEKDLLKEILKKNNKKDINKEVFGASGKMTLAYTASKVLDKTGDKSWKSYIDNNPKAGVLSEKMIITSEEVINQVFLNVERILSN
ncbi:MAG: hypothetical protein H7Y07_09510 [Pyrinomonadaceae bacterium]|nr:hypothetical protein [Sphingobacteriaceae bacterium]